LIHPGWQGLYEWTNEAKLFSVGEESSSSIPSGSDALVFDGLDDYVDVDDWDIEEPQFTIEAVVVHRKISFGCSGSARMHCNLF
jgi:hypothetical protein